MNRIIPNKPIKYGLIMSLVLLLTLNSFAQLKVGDPGVTFDMNKMDPRYPQMEKWITAGARGGIPFLEDQTVKATLNDGADSDAIIAAINAVAGQGGGAVLLKNGNYRIDKMVSMRSNVSIIGESRGGAICTIYMTGGSGFYFGTGDRNCGIYRLTVQGSWGTPFYPWNISSDANDELPGNDNISIKFKESEDCWLDQVTILNSAQDPMRCNAQHTTFRDLIVDGVHKKAGGAQGYFFIQDGYNLITGCQITHIRHISLQGDGVAYNVVYDNDFRQEVSFHSGDDGNNLIENNRITLPADMPPGTSSPKPDYFAIMGPWSIQHQNSKDTNYIYKNECVEMNHQGNPRPWSDPAVVYVGPRQVKPSDPSTNFPALNANLSPIGGTFYPIVLGEEVIDYTLVPAKLEAEDYSKQLGIKAENTEDVGGGENIGFIEDTDYIKFNIEVPATGNYLVDFRVASNAAGGTIELRLGNDLVGSVAVTNTGGWQQWTTVGSLFEFAEGEHELTLTFKGGNGYLFNMNWLEIKEETITGNTLGIHNELSVYPNPTNGIVHLSKLSEWQLYNLNGVMLDYGTGATISLIKQNKGVYWVSIGGRRYKIVNQ